MFGASESTSLILLASLTESEGMVISRHVGDL